MEDKATKVWAASERIELTTPGEIRAWSAALGCSTVELQAAVGVVGHSTARVRDYLRARKRQTLKDRGSQGLYALVLGALAMVAVLLIRQVTDA